MACLLLLKLLLETLLLLSVLTVAGFLHAPCHGIFGVPVVNGALAVASFPAVAGVPADPGVL
jgi:hypothetical protein